MIYKRQGIRYNPPDRNSPPMSTSTINPVIALATSCRKTLDFTGRATRSEFWWTCLFWWGAVPELWEIIGGGLAWVETACPWLALALAAALVAFMALTTLSCAVRRLHDVGLRGWWLLIPILAALAFNLYIPLSDFIEPDTLLVTLTVSLFSLQALSFLLTIIALALPTRPSA